METIVIFALIFLLILRENPIRKDKPPSSDEKKDSHDCSDCPYKKDTHNKKKK